MLAARIALAVTQRMPLATVAWHPVTAPATLILQATGLLADLFGEPRAWHGRTLPATPSRTPVAPAATSGSAAATNGLS